jgi:hypothetical protein
MESSSIYILDKLISLLENSATSRLQFIGTLLVLPLPFEHQTLMDTNIVSRHKDILNGIQKLQFVLSLNRIGSHDERTSVIKSIVEKEQSYVIPSILQKVNTNGKNKTTATTDVTSPSLVYHWIHQTLPVIVMNYHTRNNDSCETSGDEEGSDRRQRQLPQPQPQQSFQRQQQTCKMGNNFCYGKQQTFIPAAS